MQGRGIIVLAGLCVLAAASAGMALDGSVNVANVAPVVVSVTLPGASIDPTAGTTTSVSTTIVVTDANGYNDVSSVTLEVLKPDGTTHVAASAAAFDSGSLTSATYKKTFAMNFYDAPAAGASTYKVKVVATDSQGAAADNVADLAAFHYAELVALSLGSASVDFGASLDPGDASAIQPLTVQNYGNVQIDVDVSGTALDHATESASLPVSSVAYDTASDMSGSAALSGSASTLSAFDLAKGASSTKDLYLQLTVPTGDDQWVPSGTYSGTLTVAAVSG
jgi:hypothetical protein